MSTNTYIPIPTTDLYDWPSPEHARFGLGTKLPSIPTRNMEAILGSYPTSRSQATRIQDLEHPIYKARIRDWEKWRLVYEAGENFIEEYLERFSQRENPIDYQKRKSITPIPAFATTAINEIRNSVFQRIGDTIRTGGSQTYQKAVLGEIGGVNLHSATMNWFIGHHILSELLVMQKVGVYVDAPQFGPTLATKGEKHPYFYPYRAEDIKNWTYNTAPESNSEFSSVLLREYTYTLDPSTGLPLKETPRFRHIFINPNTNRVNLQFYDHNGVMDGGTIELQLTKIPFIAFEITESLMRNVANHQIALMNMESADVSYALKANFPFYTEQFDGKNNNPFLRDAQSAFDDYYAGAYPPGEATVAKVTGMAPGSPIVTPAAEGTNQIVSPSGNTISSPANANADIGAVQGRRYPKGMERPAFINPSSEPLRVSMEKQRSLKDDIRSLVHLALSSVQSKSVAAESKLVDREQGLESGLASIGLELEHGERQLAEYWAAYEATETSTINYPRHWSLKTLKEAQEEIKNWSTLRDELPSRTFKSEVNKVIVTTIMGTKLPPALLDKIYSELDSAKGGTSDPKIIASDVNIGVLGPDTASELRGYPDGEVEAAQQARAARLALIAQAQSTPNTTENAAARGLPDASPDPAIAAELEKQGKKGRGAGQ